MPVVGAFVMTCVCMFGDGKSAGLSSKRRRSWVIQGPWWRRRQSFFGVFATHGAVFFLSSSIRSVLQVTIVQSENKFLVASWPRVQKGVADRRRFTELTKNPNDYNRIVNLVLGYHSPVVATNCIHMQESSLAWVHVVFRDTITQATYKQQACRRQWTRLEILAFLDFIDKLAVNLKRDVQNHGPRVRIVVLAIGISTLVNMVMYDSNDSFTLLWRVFERQYPMWPGSRVCGIWVDPEPRVYSTVYMGVVL